MAALTTERDTSQLGDGAYPTSKLSYKVKAAVKCLQGGIAALDAGFVKPGVAATGLVVIGVFNKTADNTLGASGAIEAEVLEGIFPFLSAGAGDQLAQADVGANVFLVDDQTVAKTDGGATRSTAGRLMRVEGTKFYVRLKNG